MIRRASGFTLVEVLVAMVVIAVGLLGVAKLQALAMSSTGTAGKRSVAALQAAGMASAMHADRGYWTSAAALTTTTVTNISFVSNDATLNPAANCLGLKNCSTADMASYDLLRWAASLQLTLGTGYTGTIVCNPPTAGPTPETCSITLTWIEQNVAAGTAQAAAAKANALANQQAAIQVPTYELYVTP